MAGEIELQNNTSLDVLSEHMIFVLANVQPTTMGWISLHPAKQYHPLPFPKRDAKRTRGI